MSVSFSYGLYGKWPTSSFNFYAHRSRIFYMTSLLAKHSKQIQLSFNKTNLSRSVLITYEFVVVHFLHFGGLKLRFYTVFHLSIGCIMNNFGGLGVSNRVAMWNMYNVHISKVTRTNMLIEIFGSLKCTGTIDVWFSFPHCCKKVFAV